LVDLRTRTISPSLLSPDAHELKCLATFSAFLTVRLQMNTFRQPSWIMAYTAARAIPPAPITSPVVFEGCMTFLGDIFRLIQVMSPMKSVLSP
jgi:TRAP-type mannitol/chloroaromatic compound transport system permease large subunit